MIIEFCWAMMKPNLQPSQARRSLKLASCGEDDGAISLIDSSTMVPEVASHVVREVSEERVNGNLKQPGKNSTYRNYLFCLVFL